MLRLYLKSTYEFDKALWRQMMKYAMPVLIAGIAFTINEVFDKILLETPIARRYSRKRSR